MNVLDLHGYGSGKYDINSVIEEGDLSTLQTGDISPATPCSLYYPSKLNFKFDSVGNMYYVNAYYIIKADKTGELIWQFGVSGTYVKADTIFVDEENGWVYWGYNGSTYKIRRLSISTGQEDTAFAKTVSNTVYVYGKFGDCYYYCIDKTLYRCDSSFNTISTYISTVTGSAPRIWDMLYDDATGNIYLSIMGGYSAPYSFYIDSCDSSLVKRYSIQEGTTEGRCIIGKLSNGNIVFVNLADKKLYSINQNDGTKILSVLTTATQDIKWIVVDSNDYIYFQCFDSTNNYRVLKCSMLGVIKTFPYDTLVLVDNKSRLYLCDDSLGDKLVILKQYYTIRR